MTSDITPHPRKADGRRWHYGEFYGLRPLPPDDGRPLVLVYGNCQSEALRVLLDGALVRTVRIPPVHELERVDLPDLARTLAQTQVLVSQPVRADYRQLPLGTRQVVSLLPPTSQVVAVPVSRYAGLFPFQAIVRSAGIGDPPVVPYHDLRTLVEAATGVRAPRRATARAYREIHRDSVAELRSREQRHDTVVISDLLEGAGAQAGHTVNHPGNVVLRGLAARVLDRLGHQIDVEDPGRTLLDSVHTPLAADVLTALCLDAEATEAWLVGGVVVADDEVRDEQLRWYAEHQPMVQAGLTRHRNTLALLRLT